MLNVRKSAAICLLSLGGNAFSGTTLVNSIHQETPPGAVNSEQVLIIENDQFGNQRVLSIGHPGGTLTGPRPCAPDKPVAGMDCTGKDLRNVRWDGARMVGGQFDGADLRGASLHGAQLVNATFNDARLDDADLREAGLINSDFNNASLIRARLENARFVNTDFMDTDLRGADLTNAELVNADFMAARLEGAKWVDGRRCGEGSVGGCRFSRSQRRPINARTLHSGGDTVVTGEVETRVRVNRLIQSQSGRFNRQTATIGSVD